MDFSIRKDVVSGNQVKIIANVEDGEATEESVKSGIGKYEYRINGEKYESTESSYIVALEEGKKYENISVIAYDKAGNSKKSENELQMGKVLCVSSKGNDSNANGSLEKPYTSIEKAIENAGNGDSIFVEEGKYKLTGMTYPVPNNYTSDIRESRFSGSR